MSRGQFTGLCYLCGIPCGNTYCAEHKWAAQHLDMPYRRDALPAPTLEEVGELVQLLTSSERKLNAWRRRARQAA